MRVIWPFGKSEYFFLRGLTAFADLPVGLFCRTRGIEIALARGAKQSALSADSGPNSASQRNDAKCHEGTSQVLDAVAGEPVLLVLPRTLSTFVFRNWRFALAGPILARFGCRSGHCKTSCQLAKGQPHKAAESREYASSALTPRAVGSRLHECQSVDT